MAWDPQQYLRYEGRRLRPAVDLLAHVELESPDRVVDLGCGTGNVTRLLRRRWPAADLTGVDRSEPMLSRARERGPSGVRWVTADIATWEPEGPLDLVFSNAALHWLDGHERLFPRLMGMLAPGGVLAVQMPRNHPEPSHTLATEVALSGPWADRLAPLLRRFPVAEAATYIDLLAPISDELDVWETVYHHLLEGADPVAEWTRGSLLRPLLAALDPDAAAAFEAAYRRRLRAAYPRRSDGRTLFPFRRQFVIARRGDAHG